MTFFSAVLYSDSEFYHYKSRQKQKPTPRIYKFIVFVIRILLSLHCIKKQHTYYFFVIAFVIIFSVFSGSRLTKINFNYDFEDFFPNEDNELELYNQFRKTFEYDNEFVLIALENKSGIFKKDFLQKVDDLTKNLLALEDVRNVSSPTNLKHNSFGGLVPVQTRVLHFEDESRYQSDSAQIYQSPFLVGSYFPTDAKSISIFVKTMDVLSKKRSDRLADAIRDLVENSAFDDYHMVGRIFGQQVYLENVQKEFLTFLSLAFVIVIIFLWFSFRSLYGVIVPMAIVLVAILWTLAIMNLLGKPIDILSTMLPTMIFIAGMSDVVHFFSKYFEELAKGTAREKIYPLILKEVGFPTFLTLITTVVGFLSLLFSSIGPIREFGVFTSVGVVIAFILTYTLLPALLYFFTPTKLVSVHGSNNRTYGAMRTILFWIFRHQKTILLITAGLIVLSISGISRIKVNNILLEDLNDRVKLKQDFYFFEKHYSGVRPLEIQITLKDYTRSLLDYKLMKQLDRLDSIIKKEYGAGFVISVPNIVREIYKNVYQVAGNEFPPEDDYNEIAAQLKQNKNNREIKRIISPDGLRARISAKTSDMGSIKINAHTEKMMEFIGQNLNTDLLQIDITGAAHLVDRNNEYMVSNMTQGFVFSIVVIGLLTFFLHRSWRMVLVFILPNVIPLMIIGGIMGYAGIELKAATSLVFSIAFGIATDDTIHFISRFKIELGYGKSLMYAFKRTYFETGKPIILTTFILIGGFMSLMVSNFESTFYFGFLICITVVIAVLADLFLLPVLLFLIYGRKSK